MSRAVRDTAISKAIADRKINEDKRDFFERMWEVDPSETLSMLTSMPKPGSPAPIAATSVPSPVTRSEDYPTAYLTPEERERIAGAQAGVAPPRLMSEPGGA